MSTGVAYIETSGSEMLVLGTVVDKSFGETIIHPFSGSPKSVKAYGRSTAKVLTEDRESYEFPINNIYLHGSETTVDIAVLDTGAEFTRIYVKNHRTDTFQRVDATKNVHTFFYEPSNRGAIASVDLLINGGSLNDHRTVNPNGELSYHIENVNRNLTYIGVTENSTHTVSEVELRERQN